jgi:ABC-type Mn2+/Zn2+ transport system permease subunit
MIAGVLLVFSFLIVPSAAAILFSGNAKTYEIQASQSQSW